MNRTSQIIKILGICYALLTSKRDRTTKLKLDVRRPCQIETYGLIALKYGSFKA